MAEASGRVSAIGRAYERLAYDAEVENIDLDAYLQAVCADAMTASSNCKLHFDSTHGIRLYADRAISLALIVNGQVDGDVHCTSLIVSPKAPISGGIKARSVVVNGKVDGPISGEDVILKSHAFVTGDIQAQSLSIERGAHFDGRSLGPEVTNLRQVEEPAPNGQLERVRLALFKKEAEPKTKIARRSDLKQ